MKNRLVISQQCANYETQCQRWFQNKVDLFCFHFGKVFFISGIIGYSEGFIIFRGYLDCLHYYPKAENQSIETPLDPPEFL